MKKIKHRLLKEGQQKEHHRIVAVMPVHGRPVITIETARRLIERQPFEVIILMVGDESNEDMAKEAGAEFLQMPNIPIWKKIQDGISFARRYEPDVLIFSSSDDWISDNYISSAVRRIENDEGCYFAGFRFGIFDSINGCTYMPDHRSYHLDSGEIVSKEVLEKINWNIDDKIRCDQSTGYGRRDAFKGEGYKRIVIKDVNLLAVQGYWKTYHTIDMYKRIYNAQLVDDSYVNEHFPDVWERRRRLCL